MYSNEIHLPILITSHLSEHSLPWNNLDQLSCLWATFTKYYTNAKTTPCSLRRTRSLPNIKQQQQPSVKKIRKFFIDDEQPIKKKPLLRRSSTLPKPISLLSEMLSTAKTETGPSKSPSGLRRCQTKYCRLDQLVLNAA
ncbi:hypothetical protein RO3G_13547 [Rhizopus delemar RA 99-880]|uniref:Uncharacterized protein n=1 Tax=Rhizopus delemar (strain RA 99-880 / ATCC MYA-4621 / FGSC 9543 / NRRL 43880) TaxID=246409 RepID=I1CK56_RHIO9|nr:hypothetical protein RO3G_13547 [Rhizopus delemar RA 99-880]|eukprot:EIE88836.1 hypothetical protein RO3G_13547 [Rhizopus delemar RA 99-880]